MRYWKLDNGESVESHSHDFPVPNAHEITQDEYETFISQLTPIIPPPPRNLAQELDGLVKRIETLENKIVIS